MRYPIIFSCLSFLIISCKTTPINQKLNKQREGVWIEYYSQDSIQYKSIGKYHKGDPIKKWYYYINNKISKKEKYKRNICFTKFYFKNGKIQSRGKTKLEIINTNMHWFYFGDWKYYDERGKLMMTRKYSNGEFISETTNQKK
jgi:antitoxin component YwqK of YwqJK toxin-antitoxin module